MPRFPRFDRSGAMPTLSGVPAYRYQESLSRCITYQEVCVEQSHVEKRSKLN